MTVPPPQGPLLFKDPSSAGQQMVSEGSACGRLGGGPEREHLWKEPRNAPQDHNRANGPKIAADHGPSVSPGYRSPHTPHDHPPGQDEAEEPMR